MSSIKKFLKVLITIIVIAILVIAGINLLKKRKEEIANLPTPQVPVYVVNGALVKKGVVLEKRKFIGKIEADSTVSVSTKITGYIKNVLVSEGDTVKKGQVVAIIDEKPVKLEMENLYITIDILKNQLNSLYTQKEASEIALKTAENIYKRDLKLYQKKAISKEKLEISQTNYEKAKASYKSVLSNIKITEEKIKQTENQIKIKENELSYLTIKSPINGIVSAVLLNKGNLAVLGKAIIKIQKTENYKILVSFPSSVQIREGTEAIIRFGKIPYKTEVKKVYPETDKNGLQVAELRINKLPTNMKIGSLVNVSFILNKANGLIVPNNAILNLTKGSYVLTVKEGVFQKIPIKVVVSNENFSVIKGNITEGTPVAIAEESKLRLLAMGKRGKIITGAKDE